MNEKGSFSLRLNTLSNYSKYSSPAMSKKMKIKFHSFHEYFSQKNSMKNLKTQNNSRNKEFYNHKDKFKYNINYPKGRNNPTSPPSLLQNKTSASIFNKKNKNIKLKGKKISSASKLMNVNSSKKSYQLTESTNTLTINTSSLKNSCLSQKNFKNKIRFVRKIDLELNSLLVNRKQKQFHINFFNNNYRNKNKFKINHRVNTIYKIKNKFNSNSECETKYSNNNFFNSVNKSISPKLSEKDFDNVLNNLSRNVIYINQKNSTIKNDNHIINMLKNEKNILNKKLTKFLNGSFQLKNFAHFSKIKGENNILPLINKYTQKLNIPIENITSEENLLKLISDYLDKDKQFPESEKDIKNFDLKAKLNHDLDHLEHGRHRKSIIYDKFIINQCVNAVIPDDYEESDSYNNEDPFAKYDDKKEKNKANKDLSNISSSFGNSSSKISLNNSASSMHEKINMNYRNNVINIYNITFSPKEIINENGKKLKIVYKLIQDTNKNEKYVPCYEDGNVIKNEKMLYDLFKIQKHNENENNKNLSISLSEENSELNTDPKQKNFKIVRSRPKQSSDILTMQAKNFKKILFGKSDNVNNTINNKITKNKVSFAKDVIENATQKNKINNNKNFVNKLNKMVAKHSSNKLLKKIEKKNENIENNKEINEKIETNKTKSEKIIKPEPKISFHKKEKIIKEKHNESSDFSKLFESSSNSKSESIILNENEPKNPEYLKKKKLLHSIEKKRNKALQFLILLIKQKVENIIEKSQLIELFNDKDVRKAVDYLKKKINEGRKNNASFLLDELGPATDEEIINYLFRCFTDKHSPFYKMIHDSENNIENNELKKLMNHLKNNKIFNFLFFESVKKNELKGNNLNFEKSIGNRRREENRFKRKKASPDKKIKKKSKIGSLNFDFFQDISEERKLVAYNEVSLKNELTYQIKVTETDEGKQRFKNLLQQIENLKKLDINTYIKSIKDNYGFYKGEIKDLIEAREMEERLNTFADHLSLERIAGKYVRNIMQHEVKVKDNKFQSSMCDINKSDSIDISKK